MNNLMVTFFTLLFCLFSVSSYEQQGRNLDSLAKVLENIYKEDQEPRLALDAIAKKFGYDSEEMRSHWKKIQVTDSLNLLLVSSIIDRYGWLGARETSEKANEVLFLVIQHSDVNTQQKYLPVLQSAVDNGKAKARDYAYMFDRINANLGKFQVYGSQFRSGPSGIMQLYPVVDEPNVNKRRKQMGLDSLEIYARKARVNYKLPRHDTYKGKIVVFGILADSTQKPIADAKIYLGYRLLTTTDNYGEYVAIIDRRKKEKGLKFIKDGINLLFSL
jgi:hypothetical protein